MRIDRRVAQRKFEREVEILRKQRAALEQKGIFLVGEPSYPSVEAVYVPKRPLAIVLRQTGPNQFYGVEVPNLAARAFKARFNLSDYDLRPASIEFLDAWTSKPLDYNLMFRAFEFETTRGAQLVLLGDHPTTHKPFLCLRGIREYHEHPQHSGDDWLLYRSQMRLFDIMLALWRTAIDLTKPNLLSQPGGFQVLWVAEEKR